MGEGEGRSRHPSMQHNVFADVSHANMSVNQGVYADRKRLIPDTTLRLTEVYFRTGFDQWEKISE